MASFNMTSVHQYTKLIGSSVSVVIFSVKLADQHKQILAVMFRDGQAGTLSLRHQTGAVPIPILQIWQDSRQNRRSGYRLPALKTARPKSGTGDCLKALINCSNVMIFIKGDRNTPRCGLSKQLIAIISEIGVQYDTFDILTGATESESLLGSAYREVAIHR